MGVQVNSKMVEVLGTVAAVEQLAKSAFSIVKEILRAAKDRKDVSEKTGRLITQFQFVYALLRKIEPNFSLSEDPDLNDLQEEVPVDRQRVLLEEIDPTLLKPVLEELKLTLTQTGGEKEKFKQEDLERETKNQAVEFVKNLFHQGATKQKKKVDELITQLDNIVKKLDVALGVGTRDKVIDIHSHVVETHKVVVGLPSTIDSVDQKSTLILQQITDIKTSLPFPMPPAVHFEIALVSKLEEAASIDEDSESRADVKVEYNATRTADGWKNLDPEAAVKDANHAEGSKNLDPEPAAKDANHTLTRASKFGSYRVEHNGSLRFTMSVGEDRFFHFLKYSSAEAEPKMVFPHRNTAKHFIKGNG